MSADRLPRLLDPTDEPIKALARPPAGDPSLRLLGVSVLGFAAVIATVNAIAAFYQGHGLLGAGLLALTIVPPVLWFAANRRARLLRAVRRHPARLSFDVRGPRETCELHLHLGPAARDAATPIDPAAHARAMAAVWRCRTRDRAFFDAQGAAGDDARRSGRIVVPLPLSDDRLSLAGRVEDWACAVEYLAGRPDPQAAWLAAIACAEPQRWPRSHAALARLSVEDGWRDVLVRVCEWLADHGASPARAAAAIALEDVARLDALLAAPPSAEAVLIAALQTRWQVAPERSALERWTRDPTLARVLAKLPLPGLDGEHWLQLTAHPRIDVALSAADTALAEAPALALRTARVLLDRDDLRARAEGLPADWQRIVERALDHLGHNGELDDLRRLGGWSGAAGALGRYAERRREMLKGLIGRPETAGGLALATGAGAGGGLSEPEVG